MVKGLIVLIVAAAAFIVYALVDCAFTDRHRIRSLSKPVWALVIVILPVIGGLLWLTLGKTAATARRVIAPDDDPDFLGRTAKPVSASDRESLDERIRQLEQQLAAETHTDPRRRNDTDGEPDDDGGTLQ